MYKKLDISAQYHNINRMKHYHEPYKYYVYIMASRKNGTLYIGITNDIARRVIEHKTCISKKSFTARYKIHKLVYMEIYENPEFAIMREKQLKVWTRNKKKDLIESMNPEWKDMFEYIMC